MSSMTDIKKDISPKFRAKAFQCPHCHAFAQQTWHNIIDETRHNTLTMEYGKTVRRIYDSAECVVCKKLSFWKNKEMIYPATPSAPTPTDDMPPSVKKIYEEARLIEPHSKRAAMVLLRVCLEKLMAHLQMKGKTLNEKIKNLAKKGVTEEAIRWLLAVKVMGNEAAHIGNIDPNDKEIVEKLNKVFTTINLIVTVTITLKNMADDLTKKQPKNNNQTTQKKNP